MNEPSQRKYLSQRLWIHMQKHFLSKHIIFFQLLGLTFYDAIVSLTRQKPKLPCEIRGNYSLETPRLLGIGTGVRSPIDMESNLVVRI